jgi:putative membrane protein
MRIIRSTAAAALVVATSLVGASAWAHGHIGTTSGSTTTQQPENSPMSQQGQSKLSSADRRFFRNAYSDATAEAAIGEMAARKATSAPIQQLGQKLAADSSRQLSDLKAVAQKNGIPLPTGMEKSQQTEVSRLAGLQGTAFDHAFLTHVRAREQRMLGEMQREARSGKNADLRSYAGGEIAVVRGHVDQARNIGVTAPQPPATERPGQPKSNQNQGAWPQR